MFSRARLAVVRAICSSRYMMRALTLVVWLSLVVELAELFQRVISACRYSRMASSFSASVMGLRVLNNMVFPFGRVSLYAVKYPRKLRTREGSKRETSRYWWCGLGQSDESR